MYLYLVLHAHASNNNLDDSKANAIVGSSGTD